MAEYTTKFSIGQRVLIVSERMKEERIPCDTCDGVGELELKRGGAVPCTPCHGRGSTLVHTTRSWAVDAEQGTVGEIRIEHQGKQPPVIRYMLSHTGIGSGRLWYEHLLADSEMAAEVLVALYNRRDGYDPR